MAESASSQNLPSTSRQPSQNLPSTSRQPSHEKIYLQTHTWHAKYFHMIDKWRHKVPHYSNDKSLNIKAGYKAITENCLLQDISYYTCIQIVGEKNWLEATLKEHCDPKKIFATKMYTNGQREGTLMFFKKNGYPKYPIGNVNFFWKLSETNIKTIWIWVHPSFYSDFFDEIISSFEFKQNNAEQGRTDISHNLNDLYTNDAGCEMRILKYALNRFRLSGPTALTVLEEALHVPSLTELDLDSKNWCTTEEQDSLLCDEKLELSPDSTVSEPLVKEMIIENETDAKDLTIQDLKKKIWYTKYYREKENIETFLIQEQMWRLMKVLGSPSFLPSNMITGLTVLDPRFYLPVRRTRTQIPVSAENLGCQLPYNLNRSPIWDARIRHIVNNSCVSANTIKKLMDVSGMSNGPHFDKDAMAKIPILLVQKPAVASLGVGSRIDIIIPSRWAMAFWMALLMRSPLVGGLRETKLVVFESLGSYVPDINDPDTPAYTREALSRKEKLTNEYFSRPPDQRVNYIEFGIHSPFFCDWKNLTKGWSDVEDFYVLRDLRLLTILRTEIKIIERKNARSGSPVQRSNFLVHEFEGYKNYLVQVHLSVVSKGTAKDFAIICMPKPIDLLRFKFNRIVNYNGPVEESYPDPNEKSRKALRRVLSMQLIRLNRRRVKRKKRSQDEVSPEKFEVLHTVFNRAILAKHNKIISDHAKEMRKLDLPESTEVRHSCGREVMGYVTMGGYSYLRAECIGIGYVTLPSLLQIIRRKSSNIVLVRNTKELQYRMARLEILVDINCAS